MNFNIDKCFSEEIVHELGWKRLHAKIQLTIILNILIERMKLVFSDSIYMKADWNGPVFKLIYIMHSLCLRRELFTVIH